MIHGQKGISTFVEAVLLILITVIAATFVGSWFTNLSSSQAETIKNTTKTKMSCQFADMYIVNATYDCNSNCAAGIAHTLTMSIANSGKKDLTISKISILNTTGTIYELNLSSSQTLSVGDYLSITNISTATCNGINGAIEKIIVSTVDCSNNAYDSILGNDVTFQNC